MSGVHTPAPPLVIKTGGSPRNSVRLRGEEGRQSFGDQVTRAAGNSTVKSEIVFLVILWLRNSCPTLSLQAWAEEGFPDRSRHSRVFP